jgi:rifampin ADP-ribosylating transferase
MFAQSFFHGTRADLKPGDLIIVGHQSNFTDDKPLSWVYFAATLDAAIWGAELAAGSGRGRIYVVEPTGPIVDDPNVTDKEVSRQSDAVISLPRSAEGDRRSDAMARPRA